MNSRLLPIKTIESLESAYGTGFHLFHPDRLLHNLTRFRDSMEAEYGHCAIGYSVKTQYLPAAIRVADRFGAYTEIVSPMEMELAVRTGIHPSRIIYNGPIKTIEGIQSVLENGGMVNIDHMQEYRLIRDAFSGVDVGSVGVGLRINLDDPTYESRFGIRPGSSDFISILQDLTAGSPLRVFGLHYHSTRSDKSPDSYVERMNEMFKVIDDLPTPSDIRYLDMGGGYYGPMDENMRAQFPGAIHSIEEYGTAMGREMRRRFPDGDVRLIVEPGLALTVDIMDYYAKVLDVKDLLKRRVVLVDGSIHVVKPSRHSKNLTMHHIKATSRAPAADSHDPIRHDVGGYTCLEVDQLYENWMTTDVQPGDYLAFFNVGAYTSVFKPAFIRLGAAILMRDGIEWVSVRKPESVSDMFNAYRFD